MKMDLVTIAFILIISNIIQAVFIYMNAETNKKYQGIREYAYGSLIYSFGFFFILLTNIVSLTIYLFSVVIGNSLLILAIIFQYFGLMRFLGKKIHTFIAAILFLLSIVILSYFTYFNNITARVIIVSLSMSILSILIAFGLLKRNVSSASYPTKFLGYIYLAISILSIFRAIDAFYSNSIKEEVVPAIIQALSFTSFFIVTLITTFGFVSIINMRLRADTSENKEHFEQIFNLSPDAAVITSFADGKIVNFNQGFLSYFGFDNKEVVGKSIYDLNIYEEIGMRNEMLKVLNERELLKNVEMKFRRKDGSQIVCIVSYEKILLNNLPHVISIAHDITERKENEVDLKNSEEKYRFLTEFASDVTWVYNYTKKKYTYVSPSVFDLRGLTAEEAIEENIEDSFTPESLQILMNSISSNLKNIVSDPDSNEYFISEVQHICRGGEKIWTEVSTKYYYNDEGDIEIIGVSRNIERRKKFEKQVVYLSYHDQLTGLYNRRFYEEELKRLDSQRNLPMALVMIDVNGLKLINDAFGHVAGDIMLEKVANVFKKECRSDEIVSRIGGDEFVILMPRTNKENATRFIERINAAVSKEKIFDVVLSVSLGCAIKQEVSDDILKVFNKAEDDMYRNKISQRSSIRNQTIAIILNSLYKKNNYEKLHSKRVGALCECIAKELNWNEEDIMAVKTAGLMHDIGKIGISDIIINKTQQLNELEYNEIKRHAETGYRILSSSSEFSDVAEYVLEHHERWDGTGYPRGLKGDEISIQARIITIADSFDVMKSERAYCQDLSESEAISEIKKCAGTQFDPSVARIFVENVLGKVW